MIIWGSRARQTVVRTGHFFCPSCVEPREYTLFKWSRYFTLYFIPLFPTETLSQHVTCRQCSREFNPVVLEHSREQILAAVAPWTCTHCQNRNAASHEDCLNCGRPRQSEPCAVHVDIPTKPDNTLTA